MTAVMCSPKVSPTPYIKMEEKKSIRKIFQKTLQALFQRSKNKKDKNKEIKHDNDVKVETSLRNEIKVTPITVLMQNVEKLKKERKENLEQEDDDELKNFSFSVIEEKNKDSVIRSHLSSESGFDEAVSNKSDDENEDGKEQSKVDKLVESLQKLNVEDKKENLRVNSLVESLPNSNVDDDKERNLGEPLKNLKVDDQKTEKITDDKKTEKLTDDKKKKIVSNVVITRGPDTKSSNYVPSTHPYIDTNKNYRHFSQVNAQTFSGGQVRVNENARLDTCPELSGVLTQLDKTINVFQQNSKQEQEADFQTAMEFIIEKSSPNIPNAHPVQDSFIDSSRLNIFPTPPRSENVPSPLSDSFTYNIFNAESNTFPNNLSPSLPYNKFDNNFDCNIMSNISSPLQHHISSPATSSPLYNGDYENFQDISSSPSFLTSENYSENISFSLSPPTSSPIYNTDNEVYPTSLTTHQNYEKPADEKSTYTRPTLSPSTSSMYNSDNEKFQDITSEYLPSLSSATEEKKKEDKTKSNSSKTMKQYKDLQKEIAHAFSKKLCCQINRKSTKDIFEEYMEKLKMEERKYLCYKVAYLKLEEAYDVLYHILAHLANNEDPFQLALFSLICEKVLALKPEMFIDNYGLSLLSSAVLKCCKLPILTRYLVQCIRTVTRNDTYKPTEKYVFKKVNDQGDTLVLQCIRAGDECANTLAELLRSEAGDPPLFDVHHANINGQGALHVCCSLSHPHLLHVLLKHGDADLWRGDIKGGDTPLHLAVNSSNCDLRIVMVLFQHIDNKDRKRLAHVPNRSSNTPLEYARSAFKSRQNYPAEVLEFLKKCR